MDITRGLRWASFLVSIAATACGNDDATRVPSGTGDAGARADADAGPDLERCAEGAITRLDYPYAPELLVALNSSATAFADDNGVTLFVGPSLERTLPAADEAEYPAQIRTGPSFERLSVLHSEPTLRLSAMDRDYVYFGNQSLARIRRDGAAPSEELLKTPVGKLLLDGDFIYYDSSFRIARIPKAGGTAEQLIAPTPPGQFLLTLLGVSNGTVTWFERDIDQQLESTFKRLKPGASSPEVIGRLEPRYVVSYPALTPEGALFFVALDATVQPVKGSLQVLRVGTSAPEMIDENGIAPIVIDGPNLYYRHLTQGIVRRASSGGASTVVAAQEPTRIVAAVTVASDLYLFSESGCVYRVPKG